MVLVVHFVDVLDDVLDVLVVQLVDEEVGEVVELDVLVVQVDVVDDVLDVLIEDGAMYC